MMDNSDLTLATRLAQFNLILKQCKITNRQNNALTIENGLAAVAKVIAGVRQNSSAMYVIGNGGSAGIAGHVVTDLINAVGLRAYTLHEPSLITCMSNDYGYDNAYARLLQQMAKPGDALLAISSSGQSANILKGAVQATENHAQVITFSGFQNNNPLRRLGDVNIWINSCDYGLVELAHQFILHYITDRFSATKIARSA